MRYTATPNLLLEALSYLGAKANGYTFSWMEERLKAKGIQDLSVLQQHTEPVASLMQRLDREAPIPQDKLMRLFRDLEGFPFNTTGLYSPAFLLFYSVLGHYNNNLRTTLTDLQERTPDQIGRHILLALNLSDTIGPSTDGCADLFIDTVLSLTIPPESRLSLLEIHRRSRDLVEEIGSCLSPVVAVLERSQEEIQQISDRFGLELAQLGYETFLRKTTSLVITKDAHYNLRPFLFGMDTNLTLEQLQGSPEIVVHCSVLIHDLQELFALAKGPAAQVYEAIRLLGDRTRFDILCYLRDRPAYGSEISEHLGLARNTIHHHMSKLLNAGLVTCTVDGNRICYVTNKEHLDTLLSQQYRLLVGKQGWQQK